MTDLSQSRQTDQGNSERAAALFWTKTFFTSQSHQTDQGNSEITPEALADAEQRAREVAIPPY